MEKYKCILIVSGVTAERDSKWILIKIAKKN